MADRVKSLDDLKEGDIVEQRVNTQESGIKPHIVKEILSEMGFTEVIFGSLYPPDTPDSKVNFNRHRISACIIDGILPEDFFGNLEFYHATREKYRGYKWGRYAILDNRSNLRETPGINIIN